MLETMAPEVSIAPREEAAIGVYSRRYWMLFVFSFTYFLNGVFLTQYASMANVYGCYYGVSQDAINWTVLIFMVVYIVLMFPFSSLINYMDLRWTVICGAAFNTAGCAMQFLTVKPDSFPFVLGSAFFGALASVLQLSTPPFLAAKWFPSHQLSTACAVGVFGNQLGIALGYLLSPLMIPSDCSKKMLIEEGKFNIATIITIASIFSLILATFTFQNAPEMPPSYAQALKKEVIPESNTTTVLSMMKNKDFLLIFIIYGPMLGTAYAFGTTLNDLILRFFSNIEVEVGWMGMLFVLSGLVGSISTGYFLDYTHKFKQTTIGICVLTLIAYIVFSCLLYVNLLWIQFVTIVCFGFFLVSFTVVGFEYGIEVTYPQPEVVSASLLNLSMNISGMLMTYSISHLLNDVSPIASNIFVNVVILACCIISTFITSVYKRSTKNEIV